MMGILVIGQFIFIRLIMQNDFYQTLRRKTREVMVGNVGVGGNHPIRIQSMTTSDTRDVQATVDQIIRLADAGCEIVRVTVQGKKEAEACEAIKNDLVRKGYSIPLVADIHFYPPAALEVVEYADKVRINPGNYVDKRASFKEIVYDDKTYQVELEKLEAKFAPLVEKCKLLKRAMRIGTNHGSLSDRIMNRYGDTPAGMVESAFEFARVCRKLDYHDIIFSMKASNTRVMIEAYRLLVSEMEKLGWDYPLHLGVTEAGEGEDGRVKSSIGIGTLLLEGIGDTIRVSLTEDPWKEIDPCQRLVALASSFPSPVKISSFKRSGPVEKMQPLHRDGSVILSISREEVEAADFFEQIGCAIQLGQPEKTQATVDAVIANFDHPKLKRIQDAGIGVISSPYMVTENNWERILADRPEVIFFSPQTNGPHHARRFFEWLYAHNIQIPVILQFAYICPEEELMIRASAECGSLLCDGLGEGICLQAPLSLEKLRTLSFSILQGSRLRQSKTEFISCPGCGRTLFDLQSVAEQVRSRTSHLPGVKIAIMGCIVNGPGEMADADFGYVGSRPGKIDLYIGRQCVERNIEMNEAVDRLIALIKQQGRWVEPA